MALMIWFSRLPTSLNLFVNLLAENTGGLNDKHEDKYGKNNGVGHLGGNVGTSQNFDYTDENSADHGAGNGADTAKTAATKALIPGMAPVVEVRLEYVEQSRTPAIAARPEPIAKVRAMVPLTLTPMS